MFDAIRTPSRMMLALIESRRFAVLVRPSNDGQCSNLDDAIAAEKRRKALDTCRQMSSPAIELANKLGTQA